MGDPKNRNQAGNRGVALPLTVFVLVILGALVGSILWATHIEARAAGQMLVALAVREGADAAWPDVAARAETLGVPLLGPGDSLMVAPLILPGGVKAHAVVHRLGTEFFLIEAVGAVAGPYASEYRVQVMARLDTVANSSTATSVVLAPLPTPSWSDLPPLQ